MDFKEELEEAYGIRNQIFRETERLSHVEEMINSYEQKREAIKNKISILKKSSSYRDDDQIEVLQEKCKENFEDVKCSSQEIKVSRYSEKT